MPIKIYRVVQTGANNQLGGLKDGLFNILNQVFTEDDVKKPDTAPTPKGITIEIINL